VAAIISDRSAALLCLGLSSLDDGTLNFLADHSSLLERIYERSAPAFGPCCPGTCAYRTSGRRAGRANRILSGNVEGRRGAGRADVEGLWESVVLER